jgi:hypothetical protein
MMSSIFESSFICRSWAHFKKGKPYKLTNHEKIGAASACRALFENSSYRIQHDSVEQNLHNCILME